MDNIKLKREMKECQSTLERNEARSRRKNVMVVGIPEKSEDWSVSMEEFIEQLLRKSLSWEDSWAELKVDATHRIPVKPPVPEASPTAVLVRMALYGMREKILKEPRMYNMFV